MINGAIFDVDGTLLDSMPIWENAGERYLRSLGVEPEPDLGKKLFALSLHQSADYVNEHYKLGKTQETVLKEIIGIVDRFYRDEVQLKHGAKAFLNALYEKNILITIATSSDASYLKAAFERLDINRFFNRIFTCVEFNTNKQLPEIYLRAARGMGDALDKIYVFEDAFFAAKTAKEAGFSLAGVYDEASKKDQDRLKSISDIYITDFNEIDINRL